MTQVVRDRAQCAALVRAGLRRPGGLVVAPLDGDARDGAAELQLLGGRVDAARDPARQRRPSLPQHDLVRGRFEVAGRVYRFITVVLASAPLTLKLPMALEEMQQRGSARYRPKANEALTVELRSPLGSGSVTIKPLVDLSRAASPSPSMARAISIRSACAST